MIFFLGIPLLHIEYAAIWSVHNVLPSTCSNMIERLKNSKNTLEEEFSKACKTLNMNFTVHFTFETLAFSVRKTDMIKMFSSEGTKMTFKE